LCLRIKLWYCNHYSLPWILTIWFGTRDILCISWWCYIYFTLYFYLGNGRETLFFRKVELNYDGSTLFSWVLLCNKHYLRPMSLFCTIFYDQSISSLLNLMKLATTPMIKGVFKGTFHITPFLIDSFIMLIASTLFFSAVST
jgi:hypothetical protein